MLGVVLGALVGVGAGALIVRRYWPRVVVEQAPPIYAEPPRLPWQTRRFNVVLSTDSGGEARALYEQVRPRPKSDGVVQFYDGDALRGEKRA